MAPEQLAQLQDPETLKAFFADVKTSEIQSRLDAIKGQQETENDARVQRDHAINRLRGIAQFRKGATY